MQAAQTLTVNDRAVREYSRARHHSLLVRVLRIALPGLAALCVLGFIALVVQAYNPLAALDLAGIALEDGKLVMRQPKLEGFDKDGRPYLVSADRAMHDIKDTQDIHLETVLAEIGVRQDGRVKVEAAKGRYDRANEALILSGGVEVGDTDGTQILMTEADIDLRAGAMRSDHPVKVSTPDIEIAADRLQVFDNGKRIVFSKKVRMFINRPIHRATTGN